MRAVPGLAALLTLLGCGGPSDRECGVNEDCVQGGIVGYCLESPRSERRWCAFDDTVGCSLGGQRWGVLAGDALAGLCVEAEGAPIDAAGEPPTDASAPDAGPPPVDNGQAAEIVIGQADFVSSLPNKGAAISPFGLASPTASFVDTSLDLLFVADSSNSRITRYTLPPNPTGDRSGPVLGQPTNETGSAISQAVISMPSSVCVAGGVVYAAERGRVMVWRALATGVSNEPADIVLGQTDFTSSLPAIGPSNLSQPSALWCSEDLLMVGDSGSSRVLIWQPPPTTTAEPADLVLGQTDLYAYTSPVKPSPTALLAPTAIWFDGQRLFVVDQGFHRVMVWNELPSVNNEPADYVIGQVDMTSGDWNAGMPQPNAIGFQDPLAVVVHGGSLFVADSANNRVAVFTPVPSTSGVAMSRVLGRTSIDEVASGPTPSATSLKRPMGLAAFQDLLFVSDSGHNRVLGYRLRK